MNTIDWQGIKERNPLRELVSRYEGAPRVVKRDYDMYRCPFHDDSSPSLAVYEDHIICYAGCTINGRQSGNVFDYLVEKGLARNTVEAARLLEGSKQLPPAPQRPKTIEPDRLLTLRDVEFGTSNTARLKEALDYFQSRGIRVETSKLHRFGKYPMWPHKVQWGDGEVQTFRAPYYDMPDIAFGHVRSIELRRDDAQARTIVTTFPSEVLDKAREITGKTTIDDLIEFFFPRYKKVPGGVTRPLVKNVSSIVWHETVRGVPCLVYPKLPYVVVHEGYIKALATQDSASDSDFFIPSVSSKGAEGLGKATHAIDKVYIIADNDWVEGKDGRPGFSPGLRIAERNREFTGRNTDVRILVPPKGYKAADDMIKDGSLINWLASNGIEPIRKAANESRH